MSIIKSLFKRRQKIDFQVYDFANFLRLPQKLSITSFSSLEQAVNACPVLNSIIERRASLFAKGEFVFQKNGKQVENQTLRKIFKSPNFQDSENSFLQKIGKNLALYKNCFIFVKRKNIGGILQEGDQLYVLNTPDVEVNFKKNPFQKVSKISDIVQSYTYYTGDSYITFRPDEIIWIAARKDTVEVPYASIEMPLNTYMAAYQVYYALYRRNGGFGIFSNDAAGEQLFNSQMSDEEIMKLQEKMRAYSFNPDEYHFIITNSKLKYQPITFPISEMQLQEAMTRAIADICSIVGYEPILVLGAQGTTFANLKEATKRVYTEYVIPDAQLFETALNSSNITTDEIIISYENIEALQGNELEREEILQKKQDRLLQLYENGLISQEDIQKLLTV